MKQSDVTHTGTSARSSPRASPPTSATSTVGGSLVRPSHPPAASAARSALTTGGKNNMAMARSQAPTFAHSTLR